jgi:hypothetical protein
MERLRQREARRLANLVSATERARDIIKHLLDGVRRPFVKGSLPDLADDHIAVIEKAVKPFKK